MHFYYLITLLSGELQTPKISNGINFFLPFLQTLKPDPILSLKRVVGFGGGTFREVSFILHFCFSFSSCSLWFLILVLTGNKKWQR